MLSMDKRDETALDLFSGKLSIEIMESLMSSKSSQEGGADCHLSAMKVLKDAYLLGRASIMSDNRERVNILRRTRTDLENIKLANSPGYFIKEGIRRIDSLIEEYD